MVRYGVVCVWVWVCLSCVAQDITTPPASAVENTTSTCTSDADGCMFTTDMTVSENFTQEDWNETTVTESTGEVNGTVSANVTDETEPATVQPTEQATDVTTASVQVPTEAEPSFIHEEVCACDLTVDSCDIDCCCDVDCAAADRAVFSRCWQRTLPFADPWLCRQTQLLYRNNTELKVTVDASGLFCISRANVPTRFLLPARRMVNTLKEFQQLLKKRRYQRWPMGEAADHIFSAAPYKSGSVMWSYTNTTFVPFGLPSKLSSAACRVSSPVRYLRDWSGSCACSEGKCRSATHYYKDLLVVAAPHLLNQSSVLELQECPYNICIPATPFLCPPSAAVEECVEVNTTEQMEYDEDGDVRAVQYQVFHNGTRGVVRIEVYVWVVPRAELDVVTLTFSVNFLWSNGPRKPFRRSGNPGYLAGLPLPVGRKVLHFAQEQDEESEPEREAIELSEDRSQWLTVPRADADGLCSRNGRLMAFRENVRSSCRVALRRADFASIANCTSVQRQLLHLLAGYAIDNGTEAKRSDRYVAAYGNSDVEHTGDWVRVLMEGMPTSVSTATARGGHSMTCRNIVTSVHADIAFADVGSRNEPQSKVLAVAVRFGPQQDLVFKCYPLPCASLSEAATRQFEVVGTVSFLDLTRPPQPQYAEPPVYEIRLPHDFFYPFFSGGASALAGAWWCSLLVVVVAPLL